MANRRADASPAIRHQDAAGQAPRASGSPLINGRLFLRSNREELGIRSARPCPRTPKLPDKIASTDYFRPSAERVCSVQAGCLPCGVAPLVLLVEQRGP